MELSFAKDIVRAPDLSHRVRQLGYFKKHFETSAASIAARGGRVVCVDRTRLTRLFLDWHEAFLAQRAAADIDRRDYIVFSAGLMLYHLVRSEPLATRASPETGALATLSPEAARILAFWPEGFIQTSYCLSMLEAVLDQEGEAPVSLDGAIGDIRTWWSFRENVAEDPLRAIGFFDRFVGATPNWTMPGAASARPAMTGAARRLSVLH